MRVQSGRNMLIKIKDEIGGFITVAGVRKKSLKFNSKAVDITHSESEGAWRELLAGAGMKSVEISGAGIFCDSDSDALIRTHFFAQSVQDYRIEIPNFGVITGVFLVAALNYLGSYNDETTYEVTLMSAGKIQFSPQ